MRRILDSPLKSTVILRNIILPLATRINGSYNKILKNSKLFQILDPSNSDYIFLTGAYGTKSRYLTVSGT